MSDLTVLMPVRNAEATVRAAATSTLRDMGSDDVLLVFNDGSSDDTLVQLRRIGDSRLRVLSSPTSIGVAPALNVLLDEARTPLIARMDADDIVLPGRFASQVRRLGDSHAIFTSRINFGRRIKMFKPYPWLGIRASAFPWLLMLGNPVPHSAMLGLRSAVIHHGGYREGPAEDYDLWMRMVSNGANLEAMRRPGLLYRLHATQMTRKPEWVDTYRADHGLVDAHSHLCRSRGWGGPPVWSILGLRPEAQNSEEVALRDSFREFVLDGLDAAGWRERVHASYLLSHPVQAGHTG